MRSLDQARESWQILRTYESVRELKDAVRLSGDDSPAGNGLRSACWKTFLLFDTLDDTIWKQTLTSSRSAYDSLKAHFLRYIDNPGEVSSEFDPLSADAESSPWSQLHRDEELRAEIMQDIDRCMPDVDFFRRPDYQRIMLDILFIFCRLNPDIGYKQGMHELLAHVLWVVEADAIDLGQASKAHGEDAMVKFFFDADAIEHDAFAVFGQVMQSSKTFYVSEGSTSIASRSQHIFNDLLPQVDPALAKHLASLEVVPQVYLIRWIRLLFGREFGMQDVLSLWDVMFAEDPTLEIVDLICTAMLIRARWHLLDGDYNSVLGILLRYPTQEAEFPPQTFALDALHLQQNLSTASANALVLKYTGRPIAAADRPSTPPALQRNTTTLSGLTSGRTPRLGLTSPRTLQTRNIEAILQNTAKNIYAQGEKLGIGKAVRSAVDEVHRKALEIREVQTPATPPWRRAGAARLDGRIRELEKRNRRLASLLASAVNELWDQQKLIAESTEKRASSDLAGTIEQLSAAIAKAQFVQVYLEEPTLELPVEEEQDTAGEEIADPLSPSGHTNLPVSPMLPTPESSQQIDERSLPADSAVPEASSLEDPSSFEDFLGTPLDTPREDPFMKQESDFTAEPKQEHDELQSATPNTPSSTPAQRPPLAQSEYSFILGQNPSTEEQGNTFGGVFRTPSQNKARAKIALFGEEASPARSPLASGVLSGESSDADFDIGSLRRAKGAKRT